jgi:hypothetical protein
LMIATYLALAQIGVWLFFKPHGGRPLARAISTAERRITRRASRWASCDTPPDHRRRLRPIAGVPSRHRPHEREPSKRTLAHAWA